MGILDEVEKELKEYEFNALMDKFKSFCKNLNGDATFSTRDALQFIFNEIAEIKANIKLKFWQEKNNE